MNQRKQRLLSAVEICKRDWRFVCNLAGGVIKITRYLAVNRFGQCFTAKGSGNSKYITIGTLSAVKSLILLYV